MYEGSIEVKKKSLVLRENGCILPFGTVSPCQPTGTAVCIIRNKKKYFEACMHFMSSVKKYTKIEHGSRSGSAVLKTALHLSVPLYAEWKIVYAYA